MMTKPIYPPLALPRAAVAIALALLPCPAMSAMPAGSVAVRTAGLHRTSPADARRLLARLERGAERACGASPFSLREIRQSVRASACWHDAMASAVQRADNPLLTRAFSAAPARPFETATACIKDLPCPAPFN